MDKIIETIIEHGPITFERFMDMALYDPESGYYSSKEKRIGREGDFYTSSHLHPVFGVIIGKQIYEMWEKIGRPEAFDIVEMGAGEGYVCRDMLEYLKSTAIFKHLNYAIIEINPLVKHRQEKLLSEFSGKVKWFQSLDDVAGVRGCFFSNELPDAFPVHLLEFQKELKEVYLKADKGELTETLGPLSNRAISDYFASINIHFDEGYRTEFNLRIREWLNDINKVLKEGFILTIDYGYSDRDYYSEDRNRGTLMCYHEHQLNENLYENIGYQDITAHVNFSSVKKWGEDIGIKTTGFTSQGAFMVSMGIDEEIRKISENSKDYAMEIARIKKLIMPQGMGDSHMVMAQYKGEGLPQLKGFSIRNQVKYL